MLDCLVIGAGPAGLTAAIYLARFRRDVLVTDSGCSRARWIPVSRNTPGFPGGICGEDLLCELREQAARFGLEPQGCRVDVLQRCGPGFEAEIDSKTVSARSVILATGIEDVLPAMEGVEEAVLAGIVRICAVCDAYETEDRRVAVYGAAENAAKHAKYMRSFARKVTLLVKEGRLDAATGRELEALGIDRVDDVTGLSWNGRDEVRVTRERGGELAFDAFYPVLGSRTRSKLAVDVGAGCTEDGSLIVNAHQQTTVPRLYAAGDVVSALNQISVAYGHAAIAATDIHNSLPSRAHG